MTRFFVSQKACFTQKRVISSVCVCVQVVMYLAGCGLQSCAMLVAKGYPDLGWNPIEGERYLSFLRFAVFCNGKIPTGLSGKPKGKKSASPFIYVLIHIYIYAQQESTTFCILQAI